MFDFQPGVHAVLVEFVSVGIQVKDIHDMTEP